MHYSQTIEAEPLNNNFESVGLEHFILLNNFGTFGFMIFVIFPIMYLLFYLTKCCHKSCKCCKKVSKRIKKMLFWGAILRLIIETYVIGFICCLLNLKKLDMNNEDLWYRGNSILTMVILPLFCIFPLISAVQLWRHWSSLETKTIKGKFGELYEGFNIKEKKMLIPWLLEYIRRRVLSFIVVYYSKEIF